MGKLDSASSDETKDGLKKGPWSAEEDQKLIDYIKMHGYGRWRTLPKNAGLRRCGKSCRLRWTNYLRPDIKRGRFSPEEKESIIHLHSVLGNKWSSIAARLPGRTDNEIKNFWNTHIKKRLFRMGIDPATHAPYTGSLELSSFLSHYAPNPYLLRMLGSTYTPDINLSDIATQHFVPKTKVDQDVLLPHNPQETPLNCCSDEFQSHVQSILASQLQNQNLLGGGDQNLSTNRNLLTSSRNCYVPNSWHSETPIANNCDFGSFQSVIEADKSYLSNNDVKYDLSSSMASSRGTLNSVSMMRSRGGCSSKEDERDSYGSSSFIFDIESDSYVNSIM